MITLMQKYCVKRLALKALVFISIISYVCCFLLPLNNNIKSKISSPKSNVKYFNQQRLYNLPDEILLDQNPEVSRLNEDKDELIDWIRSENGLFRVTLETLPTGWILSAKNSHAIGTTLLKVPEKLCIFSNPSKMKETLSENSVALVNTFSPSQWRARLAIGILSERVRSLSFFHPYTRNLPFEHWGHPVFYSEQEFSLLQDMSMMKRTSDRCQFLGAVVRNILRPLQNTAMDPFSGHTADVNALGWGFAIASSRAIRFIDGAKVLDDEIVLVPGIDMASHSPSPTCKVIHKDGCYELVTTRAVTPGEELTIDYGPLSNDELLGNFGFTTDNNLHDFQMINCDTTLINVARIVMGQVHEADMVDYQNSQNYFDVSSLAPITGPSVSSTVSSTGPSVGSTVDRPEALKMVGRRCEVYSEDWLHSWQKDWLAVLDLAGPNKNMSFKLGVRSSSIDPRLWAFLRIVYSSSEEDLLRHGYNPFLLQSPASVTSVETETEVIKTLVGIAGVITKAYGTDIETDLATLSMNDFQQVKMELGAQVASSVLPKAQSADIVTDVHEVLRYAFNIPEPLPDSPTLRKLKLSATAETLGTPSANTIESNEASLDINSLGINLPPSTREILKYRIRKKKNLIALIVSLGHTFEMLSESLSIEDDLLPFETTTAEEEAANRSATSIEIAEKSKVRDLEFRAEVLSRSSMLAASYAGKGLDL